MLGCPVGCRAGQVPAGHTRHRLSAWPVWGVDMSSEGTAVPGDFPDGVVALDVWRYVSVDCAVGSLGRRLYGLARVASWKRGSTRYERAHHLDGSVAHTLAPENLWPWAAFDVGPLSRYWAHEVRARFVSAMSPELFAWDQHGHTWLVEKVHHEVNEFVDSVLRVAAPRQRESGEAPGMEVPPPGADAGQITLRSGRFSGTRPGGATEIRSNG